MALSKNIDKYIQNSLIRGRLCSWDKSVINVFTAAAIQDTEFYYMLIDNALAAWNGILHNNSINIQFQKVITPQSADITVHWVKVGRVYEGMCKYVSVVGDKIKKAAIDVGLENEFSGKQTTDLSIYCAVMHEFGHALGLGHGVEIDDIMYVPHQKNIAVPSENDIFVLKKIYLG